MTQKSWRDILPVHPAADLFPMMSRDELRARQGHQKTRTESTGHPMVT
jgi:hypothetical protein